MEYAVLVERCLEDLGAAFGVRIEAEDAHALGRELATSDHAADFADEMLAVSLDDVDGAVVVGGEFAVCYQLSAILIKASDGTPGFDDTTNGGGEYKVWISTSPTFGGGTNKTDNFKVRVGAPVEIDTRFFSDLNADGADEILLPNRDANGSRLSVYYGQAGAADRSIADATYTFAFGQFNSAVVATCGNFDGDAAGTDDLCFANDLDGGFAIVHQ